MPHGPVIWHGPKGCNPLNGGVELDGDPTGDIPVGADLDLWAYGYAFGKMTRRRPR
ncbi:MAG: hypothetical protein RIS21_503 [Planctomycetota bacterium]